MQKTLKGRDVNLGKIQIIDLIRTFSILTVLALHLKPTLPLPEPAYRWGWDHFQRNGAYGVTAFFVVSGFLITRLIDSGRDRLLKPRMKEFYVRRAARILPLMLLVALLGTLLTYSLDGSSKKYHYCFMNPGVRLTPLFWASFATFSYNWFQALNPLNYPGIYWASLWSLSVEEQFYLFYPVALKRLGSEKKLALFLVLVIAVALTWRFGVFRLGVEGDAMSIRSSFGAFDQIAFGALLYLTQKRLGAQLLRRPAASWTLCLSGAFITTWTYLTTFTADRVDLVYGPTFIALGVFLFLLGGFQIRLFESKRLVWAAVPGRYSYGMYLWHASVLYFIHPFLWDMNIILAFFLFAAAVTLVGAFSFHFFEKPANRMIRKYFGAGTAS